MISSDYRQSQRTVWQLPACPLSPLLWMLLFFLTVFPTDQQQLQYHQHFLEWVHREVRGSHRLFCLFVISFQQLNVPGQSDLSVGDFFDTLSLSFWSLLSQFLLHLWSWIPIIKTLFHVCNCFHYWKLNDIGIFFLEVGATITKT